MEICTILTVLSFSMHFTTSVTIFFIFHFQTTDNEDVDDDNDVDDDDDVM